MNTNFSSSKRLSLLSLTLIISGFSLFSSETVVAETQSKNSDRQGWPTRRVGGGSRGCGLENAEGSTTQQCRPLVALIPEGLVLTTESLPNLWFYLPPLLNSGVQIEFVLRDENDQLVYESTFKPTHQDSITSFQMATSKTFQGLREGKAYHWYFSLIYNPEDRAHDDVVEGWVQRVPLNTTVAQQLQRATPIEKVQIYQQANLWPEAIATLASLKQLDPNDPQIFQRWQQLLSSLELPLSSN